MRLAPALSGAAALWLAGCHLHGHGHHPGAVHATRVVVVEEDAHAHGPPGGGAVAVQRTHVHDERCGHYWYNGQWYHHPNHVHGPGCGHVYHDGAWVLAGAVKVKPGHVHDANCGRYHHDGHWYFMRGHVHGPGCGHHWNGTMWVSVKW